MHARLDKKDLSALGLAALTAVYVNARRKLPQLSEDELAMIAATTLATASGVATARVIVAAGETPESIADFERLATESILGAIRLALSQMAGQAEGATIQ